MTTVPHLLDCCTIRKYGQPGTIKAVRLVCKELSVLALQSVKRGFVQLGAKKDPVPQQMVEILGAAKLDDLDVVVMTSAGGWLCFYTSPHK